MQCKKAVVFGPTAIFSIVGGKRVLAVTVVFIVYVFIVYCLYSQAERDATLGLLLVSKHPPASGYLHVITCPHVILCHLMSLFLSHQLMLNPGHAPTHLRRWIQRKKSPISVMNRNCCQLILTST